MVGFYESMAEMARSLLLPDTQGGLGQGQITVIRTTDDKPADWPTYEEWNAPVTVKTYLLLGAVSGVNPRLVDGETIRASDQVLICADYMALISTQVGSDLAVSSNTEVPFSLTVPDVVNIDGKPYTTLQHVPIPGAGTKAAHKYVIRA